MKTRNIALVAHDARKTELVEWVKYNIERILNNDCQIYATGTTGRLIKEAIVEEIQNNPAMSSLYLDAGYDNTLEYVDNILTCLLSGPLGGDQQIGAMVAEGKIDCLIFFCDNLITQGHQQDVGALVRLASLYNVAFATNRTTADLIITSPLFSDTNYERIIPAAINAYKNRTL